MIRTKAYITREVKLLEKNRDKLLEELYILNGMVKQVGKMPFTNTKREINRALIIIEGKLAFADWVANTNEQSLPKIKEKKKKKKKKENPWKNKPKETITAEELNAKLKAKRESKKEVIIKKE